MVDRPKLWSTIWIVLQCITRLKPVKMALRLIIMLVVAERPKAENQWNVGLLHPVNSGKCASAAEKTHKSRATTGKWKRTVTYL